MSIAIDTILVALVIALNANTRLFIVFQESNTKHCQKAELTINSVQAEDNGEYMFVVASERGLAGATITLNVTVITALSDDSLVKETHSGTSGQQNYSKFTMHFVVMFYSLVFIVFLH